MAGLKPGFASSAGANSTQGASTVTSVTPIRPMAPPGSGSSISPTMTPAKMAKKYHACGASPAGAGMSAIAIATAIGTSAFQEIFMVDAFAGEEESWSVIGVRQAGATRRWEQPRGSKTKRLFHPRRGRMLIQRNR